MDQIQTLSNEVSKAISGNDTYQTYQEIYRYLLESYIGGEEYRRAGHLVRYQLETEREYNARLYQTPLDNHCKSVISVYNSFLFRENPRREFGSLTGMPEIEDILKDADFDGRSLDSFMKDVATWASVFGHCWILAVKPYTGAVTRAEEQAQGVRPYLSYLTPMVVLDWEWQRSKTGRYELVYFKYLEEVTGQIQTIKEWTPWEIYTTVVDVEHDSVQEYTEEKNGLGRIPAVICYNQKGIQRGVGVSDIADIADAQKFIYNGKSEIMQSIQMDTHPSLVATPETNVGTGSGALIHMPENLDPGLKPYLLEFSGAGVDKILSAIENQVEAIDKMANTGAIRGVESRTLSGVAMRTEFELLNARLAEKADNLELAEEQVWRLIAEYLGVRWDGSVEYPGSFNIRDTADEIQQLKLAAETVGEDPMARAEIVKQVMEWLGMETGDLPSPQSESAASNARTYPDGEPIDPRLPEAYAKYDADAEEKQKCYNCAAYKDGKCAVWDNANVRGNYWCARWVPIEVEGE
jgi:hypothetical protein